MSARPAPPPWVTLYDEGLPATIAPVHGTVLDMFAASVASAPGAPLVHYFGRTLSVDDVHAMSDALAVGLGEHGVRAGDRVALYLQNVPQFVIAALAVWKAGGIVVSCNPMLRAGELHRQLEDSGASAMVTLEGLFEESGRAGVAGTSIDLVVATSELEFRDEAPPQRPRPRGTVDLVDLLRRHAGDRPAGAAVQPEDVAVLTYTSGTTGPPKGAMNTHRNMVYTAHVYRDWAHITTDDAILGIAPLFHVTGLIAHLALGLLAPAPIVLTYRFDASLTCALIERYRTTFTVAAITAFHALLSAPDRARHDLSSLTKAYSGGAPIAAAFVDEYERATGTTIRSAYGLTETTSPTHLTPLGRRTPVDPATGTFSAGIPVFGTTSRIVDEAGREVPPGEIGEVLIRGPQVVPGYWNQPEETAHALPDGELRTGDIGFVDRDGWLYIVDRRKDLIVASGYKVWPREVEDVLYAHPAVLEAAAVGVPDRYRGETVWAFVSLAPGAASDADELTAHCREHLAAYKRPSRITVMEALPKTASGKILRRTLRDEAVARQPADAG